jgi:hypothetical protein
MKRSVQRQHSEPYQVLLRVWRRWQLKGQNISERRAEKGGKEMENNILCSKVSSEALNPVLNSVKAELLSVTKVCYQVVGQTTTTLPPVIINSAWPFIATFQ